MLNIVKIVFNNDTTKEIKDLHLITDEMVISEMQSDTETNTVFNCNMGLTNLLLFIDHELNMYTHDEIKEQGGSFVFENRVWTIANTKQYNDYVVNVVQNAGNNLKELQSMGVN